MLNIQNIRRALWHHPYLTAFGCCVLLTLLTFGAFGNFPETTIPLTGLLLWGAGVPLWVQLVRRRFAKTSRRTVNGLCAALSLLWGGILLFWGHLFTTAVNPQWHILLLGAVCGGLFLWHRRQCGEREAVVLILLLSTTLRLAYILYTSCYTRQHDVGTFGAIEGGGHAAYIEMLLQTHHLTAENPEHIWQFYHPPLHHALCALWIWLWEGLGVSGDHARESIQCLTLFYSTCITITAYRIMRRLRLHGLSLYAPLTLVAFHPCFTLLSGSINNDVLSVALIVGALYETLVYAQERGSLTLWKIFLCIGLGMMTKLSAALAALPIGAVLLAVLIADTRRAEKAAWLRTFLRQTAGYGGGVLLAAVLGLWYPLRSRILFGLPLTYVQKMDPSAAQYVGDMPVLNRFTDFTMTTVYEQFAYSGGRNEVNPLVTMLKNFVFGEYINDWSAQLSPLSLKLGGVLFWGSALLGAAAFLAMLVLLFRKCLLNGTSKLLFGGFWLVLMLGFYRLSASMPFVCSMNSRYITPCVLIGAIFLGAAMQGISESRRRGIQTGIMGLCGAFALVSAVFYMGVC